MKRRIMWLLATVNALLLVTLVARWTGDNAVHAQNVRRPADYIMIPGEVTGGTAAVVYILDTTNGMLGAMVYDDSAKQLNTMPPLDLARVFEAGGGGVAPPRGTQVAPGAKAPGR